jgi:hypothetical protein
MIFRKANDGRRTGMKKKLAILVATAATMAVAGPATADDLDGDELSFRGYPVYGAVVDDVDHENVRESSSLDGMCIAEDAALDDLVAEYEVTCYY